MIDRRPIYTVETYLTDEGELNDLSNLSNDELIKEYFSIYGTMQKLELELKKLKSNDNDSYSKSLLKEQFKDASRELAKVWEIINERGLTKEVKSQIKARKNDMDDVDS